MNAQYYGEHFNPSGMVEGTDKDINHPVVIPDADANHDQMYETPVQAIPVVETVAVVGSTDGPLTDEMPMHEPSDQEIPVVETVDVVGQVDEVIVHVDTMAKTTPYPAPVGVAMADESQVVISPVSDNALMGESSSHEEVPISTNDGLTAPQSDHEESEHFRALWNEVQGQFVDEPHTAVQQADALVSEVIVQITQMFNNEHTSLEGQWKQGNDVSTEDLRKALQHYHAFFNRLVALKQQR
jgi:hypothetical protein